jgi:hypothetical protein
LRNVGHTVYLGLLLGTGLLFTIAFGLHGREYYSTPLQERPFHSQYESLKPSGSQGHGYGVIGTLMILTGVTVYSGRKRFRMFAQVGKIRYFLEFHIFLCLVGPILVVYHTSFRIGGLVAVSFWSMVAVVASGVIGRYLYTQIPKGLAGNELSMADLMKLREELGRRLKSTGGASDAVLQMVDVIGMPPRDPSQMSLWEVLRFFVVNDLTRRSRMHELAQTLKRAGQPPAAVRAFTSLASQRAILTRRIALLQKFREIFHYWHIIHLPFSTIMFIILFVHVGVAIAFGYRWLW